jgi:hypothetical protein
MDQGIRQAVFSERESAGRDTAIQADNFAHQLGQALLNHSAMKAGKSFILQRSLGNCRLIHKLVFRQEAFGMLSGNLKRATRKHHTNETIAKLNHSILLYQPITYSSTDLDINQRFFLGNVKLQLRFGSFHRPEPDIQLPDGRRER